jgi:hypothetical protein
MLNDQIRKQVEPAAPSIESRFELIESLINKGHKVVVGINPTVSDWLPSTDSTMLLDKLKGLGVSGIWLAALHLNAKQVRTMPAKDKASLGGQVIAKGLKNSRTLQQDCFDFVNSIKAYAHQIGLEVEGMFEGDINHFFKPYKDTYPKLFPTTHDFINWCHFNKKDGDPVYYSDFVSVMQGLPSGKFNVSPYMRCMSQTLDADVRKHRGFKQRYSDLLKLAWNENRMKRMLNRYWSFAVGVHYDEKTPMEWQEDSEGNLIYYFNRKFFDEEFSIVKQ